MAGQLKDEDRSTWRAAMRGVKPLQSARKTPEESPASAPRPESRNALPPINPDWRRGDVKNSTALGAIDRRTLTRIKRGELAVDARLD
ncbi:MAG: hypothetical protein ACREED_07625, partial [Stellaceae bacterium]